MAKTKYIVAPSSKLNQIDYDFGNLIFIEDLHRIYYDGVYGRVCYDSLVQLDTEEDREQFEHPFEGFYFVEQTKTLWRYYDEEWTAIAKPNDSVRFVDKQDLPVEGESNVLYICGTEMFTWDSVSSEYVSMTSETVWHEV